MSVLIGDQAPTLQSTLVLKRDVFSTVERGRSGAPAVDVVRRRTDEVPWWSAPIARHLLARERRALAIAGELGSAPRLLFAGSGMLVRSWIDGLPLHVARPHGDAAFFRSAKTALHRLHRAGICHNDLAKEQNWLRGADGRAYLTDFQLATIFRRRGMLFRIAAHEDLRHLLKHKQRYAPEAITAAERRMLTRKSWPARLWMASGKKVYQWITRGVFGYADREGGGPRLVYDAPVIAERLKQHAAVRDVAIVAFPDRQSGTGLYAFVEATDLTEDSLRAFLAGTAKLPEHLQVTDALPRNANGEIRLEILQLIAMNQVDLVDRLLNGDAERALVARIMSARRNFRDRFAF